MNQTNNVPKQAEVPIPRELQSNWRDGSLSSLSIDSEDDTNLLSQVNYFGLLLDY